MLHALHALAVQLSPEIGSSGIQELETDTFKLHCSQTLTGVKFLVVAEPKQAGVDQVWLGHELIFFLFPFCKLHALWF